MQIVSQKGNAIEKVLRDKEGRLVRATFYIYESAGRIKARLIDFKYLNEEEFDNSSNFALSGYEKEQKYFTKVFEKALISPYITSENIYFSGSKPRAPTL